MQRPRKSSSTAGPGTTEREQVFRAATAGLSITQSASREVETFLIGAIKGLEKSLQNVLQPKDGATSPGGLMQCMTTLMVEELIDRVSRIVGDDRENAAASDVAARGAAAGTRPARKRKTSRGAAGSKARRTRGSSS